MTTCVIPAPGPNDDFGTWFDREFDREDGAATPTDLTCIDPPASVLLDEPMVAADPVDTVGTDGRRPG